MQQDSDRFPHASGETERQTSADLWTEWLLESRFAGLSDEERARRVAGLLRTRDRVIAAADLGSGEQVIDAGCGTGLLTFAALDAVGRSGRVTALDISADALAEVRRLAAEMRIETQIQTLIGGVEQMPIAAGVANAVVERSVLIYVADKGRALAEYRRVLQPHGRASIFEPINAEAEHRYGFDLRPVAALHARVQAASARAASELPSMLDFRADDLVRLLRSAGFRSVEVSIEMTGWSIDSGDEWRRRLESKPNPLAVSHRDLLQRTLGADVERYVTFMADGVEREGYQFSCPNAYLLAVA